MKLQGVALWCGVLILTSAIRNDASAAGLDRNQNGLNDVWELLYNAEALAASADPDGDGISNAAESAAGTDPRDSNSYPRLEIKGNHLSWNSVPGKRYELISTSNF